MPGPAVEALLYLLDQAFDGDHEHSLLANVRDVTDVDWAVKPPGGSRSIRAIFRHCGWAKYMYQNHAFGDRSLKWDDEVLRRPVAEDDQTPIASHIEWARDGHRLLCDSIASLAGGDLLAERRTHWGELMETRKIIAVMIEHDLYHAGEINHLRAMLQGTDRWPGG